MKSHVHIDHEFRIGRRLRASAAFFLALFLLAGGASAGVIVDWEMSVAGGWDVAAIDVDAAGNAFVAGSGWTGSHVGFQTVKYSADGEEEWVETWCPSMYGANRAWPNDIAVDSQGNAIVGGLYIREYHSAFYLYATLKYDTDGNLEWEQICCEPTLHGVRAVALDGDDNIYVTGEAHEYAGDYCTLKYNPAGGQQWVAGYEVGSYIDTEPTALAVDGQGNVYVTGHHNGDYASVKYSTDGDTLWAARYADGTATALALDSLADVYVTGTSGSDCVTLKYSTDGDSLWAAQYVGGSASGIVVDSGGNACITGSNGADYLTIKYDTDGNEQWVVTYDGPAGGADGAQAITGDDQGNVYVTGNCSTIKYSPEGKQLWVVQRSGEDIALDADGNVFVIRGDFVTTKLAQRTTIRVDMSGGGDYLSIQDGIDAASEGDTVLVATGTYTGIGNRDLDFHGTDILLTSEAGSDSTIIDCEGAGRGFHFHSGESSSSVVDGFTVANGTAQVSGGGVLCTDASSPTIRNSVITQNVCFLGNGGGVCSEAGSSPSLFDCIISDNSSGFSAGMACSDGSPSLVNVTFSGNVATEDHGGLSCSACTLSLVGCTFSDNVAQDYFGGGFSCYSSDVTLRDVLFTGNSTIYGGAMYCSQTVANLTDVTFVDNYAVWSGAGMFCTGSAVTIDSCHFALNECSSHGGGIYDGGPDGGSQLTISNTTFYGNSAGDMGGGVDCHGTISLQGCVFDSNAADFGGSALQSEGDAVVADCDFTANLSASTMVPGAAIAATGGTLELLSCTLSGNTNGLLLGGDAAAHANSCSFVDNVGDGIRGDWWSPFTGSCDVENTIIAFSEGASISCTEEGTFSLACCDLYANAGGDWVSCIADQSGVNGNISEDPLFCDAQSGDFTIEVASPCAPHANPDCGLIGAHGVGCPPVPVIATVLDLPNDQGRQVRLRWFRSIYDAPGDSVHITGYGVYRREDAVVAQGTFESGATAGAKRSQDAAETGFPPAAQRFDGWDYIATVPAHGQPAYQMIAPTVCDSTEAEGICWSVFLVTATTDDPFTFFNSPPDSGYSVDNLAPEPPPSLRGDFGPDTGSIALTWPPSGSVDLQYYELHRGTGSDFTPSLDNRVYADVDTAFVDASMQWDESTYYKVAAVDGAGNRSEYALASALSTDVPDALPTVSWVGQNQPNPFGPGVTGTRISYAVAAPGGRVQIRVYNLSGDLVRVLVDEEQSPGMHAVQWDGKDDRGQRVCSGVYFCQADAPGLRERRKMVLLR